VRRCAGGGGGRTRGRRHGAFGYGDSSSPRHLREKLGCACVLSFPRASFGTGTDPQIHRGRRTCCPLRGALVRVAAVPINGGAGEGEQGEQTGLLAAGTCGIGARGRRVGCAARRSGWSGREAHLVDLRHLAASGTVWKKVTSPKKGGRRREPGLFWRQQQA